MGEVGQNRGCCESSELPIVVPGPSWRRIVEFWSEQGRVRQIFLGRGRRRPLPKIPRLPGRREGNSSYCRCALRICATKGVHPKVLRPSCAQNSPETFNQTVKLSISASVEVGSIPIAHSTFCASLE